jgi:hypothetical protein
LETRGLHALAREEAVDRLSMNSEYTSNPHCVEPAVVDETPNGLRMDAELVRNLSDADEGWFSAGGRHGRGEDSQVPADDAWAEGTNWPGL